MKANRKFRGEDEAVSPVIAVILMVAITVVLAATVYVWVSGFGSQSSQPAKTISLTSNGALASSPSSSPTVWWKNYTVASATSGMKYSDITATLNGATSTFDNPASCGETADNKWKACAAGASRASTDVVSAGDIVTFRSSTSLSGQTLRVLDSQANSVILTLTIG